MKISQIPSLKINDLEKQVNQVKKSDTENAFGKLIENVRVAQNESAKLTDKFISGEDVELHEVMIAGEKAKTSFELLMEIRNKTLNMYQELTRISV